MPSVIRGVVERIRTSAGGTGRMRGTGTAFAALTGGCLSALLLATSGGLWVATTSAARAVERVTVFTGLAERPLGMVNGSVDVLLVATDRVEDTRAVRYAVLAHLSRRHDSAVLVDLPAGSLVDVPAHTTPAGKRVGAGRLSLADAYAHGGPRLLVRSFEAASQVRLDGYVELSLPDVAALVDGLDGMRVCIPLPVDDARAKLRLAPGPHRLTGAQAVAYLGSTGGGPLERVRHNQLLFAAVANRLFGTRAAFTPTANRELLRRSAHVLRVDEGFDLTLARRVTLALRDPYGDRVDIVPVPVARTTKTAAGTTLTWQNRLAEYLFEKLRTDTELDTRLVTAAPVPAAPGSVRVVVRNGTGMDGLAGDAADDLRGVGFRVSGKAANASSRTSVTTVYYHPRYERQARTVQAALPGSRLAKVGKRTSTVVAVLGGNYAGVRQVTYAEGTAPDDTGSGDAVTATGPCG